MKIRELQISNSHQGAPLKFELSITKPKKPLWLLNRGQTGLMSTQFALKFKDLLTWVFLLENRSSAIVEEHVGGERLFDLGHSVVVLLFLRLLFLIFFRGTAIGRCIFRRDNSFAASLLGCWGVVQFLSFWSIYIKASLIISFNLTGRLQIIFLGKLFSRPFFAGRYLPLQKIRACWRLPGSLWKYLPWPSSSAKTSASSLKNLEARRDASLSYINIRS